MLKRLFLLDGVNVVCQFRDDGLLVEGYGLEEAKLQRLAMFAHDYKRIIQANADQLSMFTRLRGWTPPRGWCVHGRDQTVCSMGNLVCITTNQGASLTALLRQLEEVAHW